MSRRYLTPAVVRRLAANLSETDLAILGSVSELRFVSGGQLARMHFSEPSDPASRARTSRRTLARLAHLQLVERLPRVIGGRRAGSAGFVYRLGVAGQKLAMQFGWQLKRRVRRSVVPGTLFVGHCLQVAELHVLLVEAERSRRLELLELSAEPACWRSYMSGNGTQRILKPDSFVRIGAGEWEFVYFIEVDRGTEGSHTIDRKLADYLSYQASGKEQASRGVFPKVLWTAEDQARVEVIESCIKQLASAYRELFEVTRFNRVMETMTKV